MRFLSGRMFRIVKELDDGNKVFLYDGVYLRQLFNDRRPIIKRSWTAFDKTA